MRERKLRERKVKQKARLKINSSENNIKRVVCAGGTNTRAQKKIASFSLPLDARVPLRRAGPSLMFGLCGCTQGRTWVEKGRVVSKDFATKNINARARKRRRALS